MHERVPREHEERDEPAPAPARAESPPAAMALQLQRTAGNRATAQMVQRFGLLGLGGDLAFDYAWDKFVDSNEESASYFTPDPNWRALAIQYAAFNPADGSWISLGLRRLPDCFLGSWIVAQA